MLRRAARQLIPGNPTGTLILPNGTYSYPIAQLDASTDMIPQGVALPPRVRSPLESPGQSLGRWLGATTAARGAGFVGHLLFCENGGNPTNVRSSVPAWRLDTMAESMTVVGVERAVLWVLSLMSSRFFLTVRYFPQMPTLLVPRLAVASITKWRTQRPTRRR